MAFILLLWAKLMAGIFVSQEPLQLSNPLEGYSYQVKQPNHSIAFVNFATEDSEEDSEDSDDETASAYVSRENLDSFIQHFSYQTEHVFAYQDRLSQAHLKPILTPPDVHTTC
jgi:hypothetical protein